MPGVVSQQQGQHHHRSTTKTAHKAFKPRFSSKNEVRDRSKGRIEKADRGQRKTPHQQVMSKLDRRNQAKQRMLQRQHERDGTRSVFTGKDGAPRIVAVVPLSDDVDPQEAVDKLNDGVDIDQKDFNPATRNFVPVDRFKQKLLYIPIRRELYTALDVCRIADYVLCLLSAEEEVDEYGERILRSTESQGISNVYTAAMNVDKIDSAKKRTQTLASLKSFITHFFPGQEKVFSLDSRQDCLNVVRSLCSTTPKGVSWRSNRSWLCAEDVLWNATSTEDPSLGELVVTGVVRGRNLKADRLVRLGQWGDFQISSISAAPKAQPPRDGKGKSAMALDSAADESAPLDEPTEDQDTLDELAPEEVVMGEAELDTTSVAFTERKSVLLDDEYPVAPEPEPEEPQLPKRLPKGTSKSQAAWYLGDEVDSDSDLESVADEPDIAMADDVEPQLVRATDALGIDEAGPSTADAATTAGGDDEEDVDMAEEAGDLSTYLSEKHARGAAKSDREFPDEIELAPSVVARERLAKYRGLKSARTSAWAREADRAHEPARWARLLDVADARAARKRVLDEALVGGVRAGARVAVRLRGVARATHEAIAARAAGSAPVALHGLLRHEHKHSAVHATLSIPGDFGRAVRNKEPLVVQAGARRLLVTPTLTQAGATPNDVHKVARWAWPGETVVASWTGPVTWGAVPVVFFAAATPPPPKARALDPAQPLLLLGAGTTLPPSTSRVLAKRVVLTGQPYALHRRQTHVRHMFFNAADVAYFSALPLWTTRGRRGAVKESLGTHGQFKAVFDGKVNPQEAVGVSLWKRVWPRAAEEVEATP